MEIARRKRVYRLLQVGLIALTILVIATFISRRSSPRQVVRFETDPAAAMATPGPGDVDVFNVDTTVQLALRGDRIFAGLSPRIVEKVRGELAKPDKDDSGGLGGSIAQFVKQTVSDKIATRVVYRVEDIRDIHYEGERIVIEWRSGKEQTLFGSVKVDGNKETNRFREAEAQRFIDAVNRRRRELGSR